ncbi:hypothetical protein ACLOJK_041693 [Asimina triloba]
MTGHSHGNLLFVPDCTNWKSKKQIVELEKIGKLGKKRNPKKDDFIIYVPKSLAFFDTANANGPYFCCCCCCPLRESPHDDEIQEVRPRTPFESKLARLNSHLRTGEPPSMEDVKDWTIDVLTDAPIRAEETETKEHPMTSPVYPFINWVLIL